MKSPGRDGSRHGWGGSPSARGRGGEAPVQPSAAPRGFTLIELLLAMALGAGVLSTLVVVTRGYALGVEDIRAEEDTSLDEALHEVLTSVRQGWTVEVVDGAQKRIDVRDVYGRTTSYGLAGKVLEVARPGGAKGALVDAEITGMSLDVDTVRRLRDLSPTTGTGVYFRSPAPAGGAVQTYLAAGQELAFAFTVPSRAPSSFQIVDGVEEKILDATLGTVHLPIGYVDGTLKEFCHLHGSPPHQPNHKDYLGGRLFVTLYEARAPGDPRPLGSALASLEVDSRHVPNTGHFWYDETYAMETLPPDNPLFPADAPVCGPGEPCVPGPHLHEEDVPGGVAWGWWKNHPQIVLGLRPPTTAFPLDLSSMGVTLEPGRAYTLTVGVSGYDYLVFATRDTGSAARSSMAFKDVAGSWTPFASAFPYAMEGTHTVTQTDEVQTVSRVTVSLTAADGRVVKGSAGVSGQLAVENEWYGAVPGEAPSLEAYGQ